MRLPPGEIRTGNHKPLEICPRNREPLQIGLDCRAVAVGLCLLRPLDAATGGEFVRLNDGLDRIVGECRVVIDATLRLRKNQTFRAGQTDERLRGQDASDEDRENCGHPSGREELH